MICSDPIYPSWPGWLGIQYAFTYHHEGRDLRSALVNVNIFGVKSSLITNSWLSSFEGAITTNRTYLFLKNVTIERCTTGIVIHDFYAQDITLSDITIRNCLAGIYVKDSYFSRSSSHLAGRDLSRNPQIYLESIKISKECWKGIHIFSPIDKSIRIIDVDVRGCFYGVNITCSIFSDVKVHASKLQHGNTGMVFHNIPPFHTWMKQTQLCGGGTLNVTSPVNVTVYSYKYVQCSQVRPCMHTHRHIDTNINLLLCSKGILYPCGGGRSWHF